MEPKTLQPSLNQIPALAQVKNIIAVASGKGGVGKSTVALNLALALSKTGAKVGLLDADIYGPSIPMMLAILEKPFVRGDKIIPIEKFGIKAMSMGLLMGEETPVIWRGPMVTGILKQFLSQVEWGMLDYLVMDLPPGTGDAQLTLTQTVPISGAVIVTTPQEISLMDATRGLKMFQQVNVPVLGIVENMSYFICDGCSKRHNIFREGGGGRIAKELNLELLAEIPLDPSIAVGCDIGEPILISKQDSAITKIYLDLAGRVVSALPSKFSSNSAMSRPMEIKKIDEVTVGVLWDDRHESVYDTTFLREECPCAGCRDEWSGEKILKKNQLPKIVKAVSIDSVGQYGLKIQFSDGHSTGIFTFDNLRRLCQCSSCKKSG